MTGVHTVLGHRGYGKSRLARAIVAPARKLIVVDTLGEHSTLATPADITTIASALASNPEAYRYSVRVSDYSEVEWLERVAASREGCCLFIDEIDMWYTDARAPIGDGLNSLVRYGRHYGQSVVAVVRRPADLSRTVTSQATLWCFPMREPRDRAYVQGFANIDPGTLEVLETREGMIIRTQLARAGIRGVEIGEFNLETGQYSFPTGESFSDETP